MVSSLIDLAHLRALAGDVGRAPHLLYMHEDQFHYPRPPGVPLERGFATAHLASFLAADAIAWNSRAHQKDTTARVREYLAEVPAPHPPGVLGRLERGGRILPPGVDLEGFPEPGPREPGTPPVIVWNHRWDGDKRPGAFARTLLRLAERGQDFRLILLGPLAIEVSEPLDAIREGLGERILHAGEAKGRAAYVEQLARADLTVSTAEQENFGYAAVEAMAAGAVPLLPRRLSYPEILPRSLHDALLYDTDRELGNRLEERLRQPESIAALRPRVMEAAREHAWGGRAAALDAWVEQHLK